MSNLFSRLGLASFLGFQFGGSRDLYTVFGYKKNLTYSDYYARYLRQDVAGRIIDAPAAATWRNPPQVESEKKEFVDAWKKVAEDKQLWSNLDRADRLAGIGQYSVLLLGFPGSLNTPVKQKPDQELLYVQPYGQDCAEVIAVEDSTSSKDYGKPKMYRLKIADPLSKNFGIVGGSQQVSISYKTLEVHASRIVHIAEGLLDNNFFGRPRLQGVYNLLDDLLKIVGGSAETFWITANRGMQLDVDKDTKLSPDDAEALSEEVDEYHHGLRRFLRTKGVKVTNLGSDVPDPKNAFDVTMSLISGTSGIPKRVLLGAEAGQLASDQDRANWADRIKERRTTFAEPNVLNPFAERLMKAGVLPEVPLNEFSWTWPQNFQLTPLEEAQMMAQRARAIINLSKHFLDGTPICSVEEARQIVNLPDVPKVGKIPAPALIPPAAGGTPGKKIKDPAETDNPPNDF